MIKVFGHISPDTDSVCSAIAYAWVLNQKGEKASAYRLGKLNKETLYVLKKFKLKSPPLLENLNAGDKVIIVDTNNPRELPKNINDSEILSIIDHHKLSGGLSTEKSIPIIVKPLGSTATIIWKYAKHLGYKIPNNILGILLCAILSDTLNLTSPTTTDKERDSVKELSDLLKINPDDLAIEIFRAKSDLTGFSPEDILLTDSKIFNFGGKNTRISVLETTSPRNALKIKNKLAKAMVNQKLSENLSQMYFFVVDIFKSEATLIVPSEEEIMNAENAFKHKFVGGVMKLEGVVSRKKQIVPVLENAIKKT
ncbi:manganese-dependent inorganic pyrophosphatase [Patescibacteria group bacterium]